MVLPHAAAVSRPSTPKANPTNGQFVWSQVEILPLLLVDALTQDFRWSRT